MGKTQLAVEYAYRYRQDYDAVLWVQAETQTTLTSGFIALAELFSLPEKVEEEQSKIVAAVLRWLNRHKGWLLIFDNVEDLALLKPFLPTCDQGALLLTTRLQTLGTLAQTVELFPMTMQEGINFLLARTKSLRRGEAPVQATQQEKAAAEAIVAEMGGLPLALEQAGAYIDATQCSLPDYLHLFQISQYHLLDAHEASSDHPLSVSKTFALAFERIKQQNPSAAYLLTICAFLAPETIPEMFFLEGASWLGPTCEAFVDNPLAFQEAVKALLSYSLLQRHKAEQTVTLHRLVQVVLKGLLTDAEQHRWMEQMIAVMSHLFPSEEQIQADYWRFCDRLLPHALACLASSTYWGEGKEHAISLMNHVAAYLSKRARYTEAASLLQRALRAEEQALQSEHPLLAETLHGLAEVYREQGNYEQAEPLYQRAISIREQALGAEHHHLAESLTKLGALYWQQGKYEQAESCYQRALRIREQAAGPEHSLVAEPLHNLGVLYWQQGHYEQAESCYQRALRIWEQAHGPEHPRVAYPLYNLGNLYREQGKYEQAEFHYQRALRIWEQTFGPEHPRVAFPLNNLGNLYKRQSEYKQAELLYRRALQIREQTLGPEHPHVADSLNDLGGLYLEQGKYEQAELHYQRALRIWEQTLGANHTDVALSLNNLAELYTRQGNYEQAEALYQRALQIREQALGSDHAHVTYPLAGLANLYREQGKYEQALPLYQRALALRQQQLGPQHPETANILYDLARFYQMQQQTTEALSRYQQALAIREQALGLNHPETKKARNSYVELLRGVARKP